MEALESYVALDRRLALGQRLVLPERTQGAALFADVSGFTALTEGLARSLGARRGAEELSTYINSVYEALLAEVERYGGSVIAFAGDAVTCWFDGDNGSRATTAAWRMQAAITEFAAIRLPDGELRSLAVRTGVALGPAHRFLLGASELYLLDVLAGQTLKSMAEAAALAQRGEVVVDADCAAQLEHQAVVNQWRQTQGGAAYGVIGELTTEASPQPWPPVPVLQPEQLRPYLLKPVYERLGAGQGEFLTELRPAVAMFLQFEGLDYDGDPAVGEQLNQYVKWVQAVVEKFGGFLLSVAMGDKGSHLYCCFGAPIAHENSAWRALAAAQELRAPPVELGFITATRIGVSSGTMRTGAYGSVRRRTYGVLGDDVNLAARLMEHAAPGQVLASGQVRRAVGQAFAWQEFAPIKAKGKTEPVPVFALLSRSGGGDSGVTEPQYALPMVGRERELGLIIEKLDAAVGSHGQLVAITAEAGLGKSRLVAEAVQQARARGYKACIGQCQAHGRNTSYLGWQGIWRSVLEVDAAAPVADQLAALTKLLEQVDPVLVNRLPLLAPLLQIPISDNELTAPLEARLRKSALESMLVECLRKLSREQPFLLVVEDTHWSDALSRELLEVVARSLANLKVVLLVTSRPLDAAQVVAPAFLQLPHTSSVNLGAFTDAEATRLLQLKLVQLFDFEGPPPPVLLGRLIVRSAGNPFYLEELLNFLRDQRIDFQDPTAVGKLELPDSLHSLVLSRIDRLTETQQAALKIASVVGRFFPAAVIWGLQPQMQRENVAADLAQLCQVELTAQDRPEPELAYIFKHVVTQEVAYESLPHSTRARLHTEIGSLLETLYADRLAQFLDLLAFHFDHGLDPTKKRHYLCQAGEAAQTQYANEAAISYFERALPLLSPADSIPIFLKLGKVWELKGDWKKAGTNYQRAFEAAAGLGDRTGQARAQAATGDLLRKQGLFAEATDWLGLAQSCFEELGDLAGVGQTLHALGTVAAMQGDYANAQSFYERSLELRRRLQDKPQIASLCSNLGIIARFQLRLDQARELAEESLRLRRETGDRWAIGNSLNNLGVLLRDTGELDRARSVLEESLVLSRQVGDPWAIANGLNSLAEVALDQKDWQAARTFLHESLATNLELGDRTAVAFVLECFASMAAEQANPSLALRLAGATSALRKSIGSPLSPAEQARLDRYLEPARRALSTEAAMGATREGENWSLEQASAAVAAV